LGLACKRRHRFHRLHRQKNSISIVTSRSCRLDLAVRLRLASSARVGNLLSAHQGRVLNGSCFRTKKITPISFR
jgi:hypothetical protein